MVTSIGERMVGREKAKTETDVTKEIRERHLVLPSSYRMG